MLLFAHCCFRACLVAAASFIWATGSLIWLHFLLLARGSLGFLELRHLFKRPDRLEVASTTTCGLLSPLAVRLGEIGPLTPLVQKGDRKNYMLQIRAGSG